MFRNLKTTLSFMDREQRRKMNGLFLLMLGSSAAEGIGIGVLFPFVKLVGDPTLAMSVPLLPKIGAMMGLSDSLSLVILVGMAIIFAFIAKNALVMAVVGARTTFVYNNQARLARRLLARYLHAPYTWHLQMNSSRMIHAVQSYPDVVYGTVLQSYLELFAEFAALTVILLLLLMVAPIVVLTLTALVAAAAAASYLFFPQRMAALASEYHHATTDSIRTVQESLGSVKEIQVLGRADFFIRAFTVLANRRAGAQARQETLRWLPRQFIELTLAGGLILAAILLLAQDMASQDIMSVLAVFAAASFRVMPSLNRIVAASNQIHTGAPIMVELMDQAHDLLDPPAAEENVVSGNPALHDRLVLDQVTYRYAGSERPSLDKFTVEIGRGQSVGIVGPSGAGKTTLVDLVLGVLEPTQGRILVDGESVRGADWRRKVGYVPQSVFLIDDSLRRNIALGLDDEEIDEKRVAEAVRMAQLRPLLADLPHGLDTPVGERGGRLSGGQRQRIGIARALYHDPELIVFDEATSALDTVTERAIDEAIDSLHGSKTLMIVAHRLSTVQRCDSILFLKAGQLLAQGSCQTLYDTCADFRTMADLGQFAPQERV